ncbi:hypothetical protein ACFSSC_07165 [Corynebacterium mendelii]|uniref:ABC transporter substrate-binding protein n=1 Tax=Corynebacterium mendelii TaxID=2765362 RepID=A0A939E1R1_9CORY|nr:hypothetical protein [Corynebacterium mendelii]MBN9644891.1 hypothetical protein [Corynebacterium mendelii]
MESRRSVVRATLLAAAATVACGTVAGCAEEPGPDPLDSDFRPIRISVNANSEEQRILGEIYQRALNNAGHGAYLSMETVPVDHHRLHRLNELSGDLIVGCTGELLNQLNPVQAQRLSTEWVAATTGATQGELKNSGDWREKVYQAMVGSLPGNMLASDPSNAIGCDDYDGPPLPQHIVPVYRKPMLDRGDRLILNKVGGTITTADIEELVKKARREGSVGFAVTGYMADNDL